MVVELWIQYGDVFKTSGVVRFVSDSTFLVPYPSPSQFLPEGPFRSCNPFIPINVMNYYVCKSSVLTSCSREGLLPVHLNLIDKKEVIYSEGTVETTG